MTPNSMDKSSEATRYLLGPGCNDYPYGILATRPSVYKQNEMLFHTHSHGVLLHVDQSVGGRSR